MRRLVLGAATLTLVGMLLAAYNGGLLFGPSHPDGMEIAAATTHVFVDEPGPPITQRVVTDETMVRRAEMLARIMVSSPGLDRIAKQASVPRDRLSGIARTTAYVPAQLLEPRSEERASQIAGSTDPYRLEVQARPSKPIIDVYVQAPTVEEAERLANASVTGMEDYIRDLAAEQGFAEAEPLVLSQIGTVRGGVLNGKTPFVIAIISFAAFILTCATVACVVHLWRRRHRRAEAVQSQVADDDAWPHTTRLLPWTFAVFLAVLWLVPFDSIELLIPSPIDLKFDRLILPMVVGAWIVAVLLGGRFAPRLRLTWIHAAMGTFLALAFISVALDAQYLNHTLELDLSVKKLPLLVSYISLFVIASTAVRAGEVRPFLTYTVVLAVIMALGMIWEFRFKQNFFYQLSDQLLPGIFDVTRDADDAVDSLGRRMVRGSASVPLEAVTMLTLAFPIGLVRLLGAKGWKRLAYAFAVCMMAAAMLATFRKSGFLAPVAVVLGLAYFRRRELLRLAPLGLVLVAVITVISPGAIGSTVNQFTRSDRSTVPTVSDRASDYDAVRPDLWTHLAFGRGWGSYNHQSYRILDSEILHRTLEMGVLGLLSFLVVALAVVFSARRMIASRDPTWAQPALIGATAAIGFLVTATLYDVMSFPHGPYIFLYMAGLVAVAIRQPTGRASPPVPPIATTTPVDYPQRWKRSEREVVARA
jgi:hypothetical protein